MDISSCDVLVVGGAGAGLRAAVAVASPNFVSSVGAALRANVLGFFVVEVDYVRALDRPQKDWQWQFNFTPGF